MANVFEIQPIGRFEGASAAVKRPREIACFSYDEEHQYHQDERSLRYYYPPRIGADLSKGFESFRQLDDTADDHLDSLLESLISLEKETGTKSDVDFVTWRGMMTKIMSVPYDNMNGNGFEMNAVSYQGTIFIEENHEFKLRQRSMQHQQRPQPGAPSQDVMSYWGYKFETLCLLPNTWHSTPREYIEGREEEVVSNYAQYCSIVKTGIGSSRMIIGGEVDAIWDSKPETKGEPINWVELKTSATIQSDRDMLKYERKLLKFWIQSFLLGVPKIIVGFRSKQGILERIEEIETVNLPNLVKRQESRTKDHTEIEIFAVAYPHGFCKSAHSPRYSKVMIDHSLTRMHRLKSVIIGDGVWRIRRQDRSPLVEVFKVEEAGTGRVLSGSFKSWRKQFEDELSEAHQTSNG